MARLVPSATIRPCKDDDPVGDLVGLIQVVGREQDRPTVRRGPTHVGPERAAGLDIHRHGRLVEEHEVGVTRDPDREPEALTLSAGQPVRRPIGQRGQPRPLKDGCLRERGGGYNRRANSTSSPTRTFVGRPVAWSIDPMRPLARGLAGGGVMAKPVETVPAVGSSSPSIRPIAVDLPAPLGPSRATVSPASMVKVDAVERDDVAKATRHAVEADRAGSGGAGDTARPGWRHRGRGHE